MRRRSRMALPVFLPCGSGPPGIQLAGRRLARRGGAGRTVAAWARCTASRCPFRPGTTAGPPGSSGEARLYTVRAILEHWVISRETWRDRPEAGPGQPELEFWRVEAAPGPGTTARVCELRREAATNAWTLRLGSG